MIILYILLGVVAIFLLYLIVNWILALHFYITLKKITQGFNKKLIDEDHYRQYVGSF